MKSYFTTDKTNSVPIKPVQTSNFDNWFAQQPKKIQNTVTITEFKAKSGSYCLITDQHGELSSVLLGVNGKDDFWPYGGLPTKLPRGQYIIESDFTDHALEKACLAWGLGCYQFNRYKQRKEITAKLVLPENVDIAWVETHIHAIYLVRDLVNTPTDDMGPSELAETIEEVAKQFNANFKQIVGDDLLAENYPAVHAVGRGSVHPPRLCEMTWGDQSHPKVTLVGKGVCFDSGGLNLKPSSGMLLMKKDMAGAAHMLALSYLIMANNLPVRLRLIVPAVENSISGSAYHPGDILATRKGLTVEITNTDAEGRLILADALAEAVKEKPDLLIDFATLTGAAGVALGHEIAALFTPDDQLAQDLAKAADSESDPIWRLPLYENYLPFMESNLADINNAALKAHGGQATLAALFLQKFVDDAEIPWAHFDIRSWNPRTLPGRPEGAEAMGLRAVYQMIKTRFA